MSNAPHNIVPLPPAQNMNTVRVLTALADTRGALGELKGTARSLPNPDILIDTLFLQEALASSEIENIVTTQDEAFRTDLLSDYGSPEAKEVARYREAMRSGYEAWLENRFINENMLIEMFRILKQRTDGYRTTLGTVLRDGQGRTIYTPPQNPQEIVRLMRDLEAFINDTESTLDPLIRMALIHHQFESIHPFPDGNGRVGRMLNVLYLTHAGLLDAPILYLSRGINATKPDYYRLLQAVREDSAWEDWTVYMLGAVEKTARSTLHLIEGIRDLMQETKQRLRDELPKIYSQDLLNNLFTHPYTRIDYLNRDLPHGPQTARKYLKQLTQASFVQKVKMGRNNYYINERLVALFARVPAEDKAREALMISRQLFEEDLPSLRELERILSDGQTPPLPIGSRQYRASVGRRKQFEFWLNAKEHVPPHFHVRANGKEAAYTIEHCDRLPNYNGFKRHDRKVREWWHDNKSLLIQKWNETRPDDCPVGKIRDD